MATLKYIQKTEKDNAQSLKKGSIGSCLGYSYSSSISKLMVRIISSPFAISALDSLLLMAK
jgi:hypothetical protein